MNAFEELMNNRWIVKARDKETYYRVKDQLEMIRPFLTDKLGYRIIINPYVIKLEKLPGEPCAWMGIGEFSTPEDYSFFCLVLMFLEDREVEEQFVLSQLTEYVSSMNPRGEIDWTVFSNRKKLVRVIKFCIKNELFLVDEGDEDAFSQIAETEALFENTGLSRYFMRSFSRDISGFTKSRDFFSSDWVDMDEDRGVVRRQRVYRKLLLSLGVYKTGSNDEDFAYIKNFRNLIEGDIGSYTDCKLQVHHSSAYLIIGPNGDLGTPFPGSGSIPDAILLFNSTIRNAVENGDLEPDSNESIFLSYVELQRLAEDCFLRYSAGLAKLYREMNAEGFALLLIGEMERLGIVDVDETTGQIKIHPIAGKFVGCYPPDFGGDGNHDSE